MDELPVDSWKLSRQYIFKVKVYSDGLKMNHRLCAIPFSLIGVLGELNAPQKGMKRLF